MNELNFKNIKTLTIDIGAYNSGFKTSVTVDRCQLKFQVIHRVGNIF